MQTDYVKPAMELLSETAVPLAGSSVVIGGGFEEWGNDYTDGFAETITWGDDNEW